MSRALVAAIALLAATACAGCKNRYEDEVGPMPGDKTTAATTTNGPAVAPTDTAAPAPTLPAFDPAIENAPDVVVLGVETIVVPGSAAPPPPPPDPFAPAIASVRASALGCFAPLPPGTYAATIVVTVTPAGTPVDVEIEPGNVPDPAVLGCLHAAADGRSYPSSPDGRKLRIDVRVQG